MGVSYETYLRNLHSKLKHSRQKTHEWNLTPEELVEIWVEQGGRCALSGVALTHHLDGSGTNEFNASIDRINNEEGYSKINVRLVAYRINIMRHTLSTDMFWWWVKTVHDHSCDEILVSVIYVRAPIIVWLDDDLIYEIKNGNARGRHRLH